MIIPKVVLLSLLYSVATQYFDKELFKRIRILTLDLNNQNLTGEEKRYIVREAIKKEFKDVSTITIDAIIQIVLLKTLQR